MYAIRSYYALWRTLGAAPCGALADGTDAGSGRTSEREDGGDAARGSTHSTYNVAKHCLELTVNIDRIQLKGNYGEGFRGAPLRVAPAPDRPATGNRDNVRGRKATQGAPSTGDHDHV